MAALKSGDIEAFLRKPDRAYSVFLLYGPDAGLAHERCRSLIEKLIDDPSDPFQLIRIDGDQLSADPTRLQDEANTVGLFETKRTIWLRAGTKPNQSSFDLLFETPPLCPVVIEAGDLAPRHALRQAVEGCRFAVALPCYADEGRDLPKLIDEVLGQFKLKADDDARQALIGSLGADRLLSRRELEKLALYAYGQGTVTSDDVDAVLSNAAQVTIDMLVDSVFSGEAQSMDSLLERAIKEGFDPSFIIGALLRHAFLLLNTQKDLEGGRSLGEIEKQSRIFYKRVSAFRRQVSLWSMTALQSAITSLGEAQLLTRQNSALADTLLSRSCLSLALAARRVAMQAR
jgi:DNA polymerase-3 subunit delta